MTEELKQAISALQCAKRGHCDHAMADEAIAALERALTQRPAAQAGEREAFEAWARPNGYDLRTNAILGHYSSIDTLRAWDGFRAGRASPPTQPAAQATPEPVGEAPIWNSIQIASWIGSQLMHEPAMFERAAVCKFVRSLGRHATLLKHSPKNHAPVPDVCKALVHLGHGQRSTNMEIKPEEALAVAWWYIEDGEEKFGHPNGYRPDDARPLVFADTRPAPGVPEGFVLVPVEPDIDILRPFFNCLNSELDTAWGVAMRTAQEKLAAAQAKGADK